MRSDETVVKGTPCPSQRIRIFAPSAAMRPAKIGSLVSAWANATGESTCVQTPLEEEHNVHGQVSDDGVACVAPDLEPSVHATV